MKHLNFLYFLLLPYLSISQDQLPNPNFENWTISANSRDSLIGWSSSSSVSPYPVQALYQDTVSFEGAYCGNIVTAPFGFTQETVNGVLVNGNATFTFLPGELGAIAFEGGGTPISIKPTSLNGYYKNVTLSTGDHSVARILVSKYNPDLQQRDTVSFTNYTFAVTDEFTYFSIPLYDLAPGIFPDTITTVFYSSNPSTIPTELGQGLWSNLYLDNLNLVPLLTDNVLTTNFEQKSIVFPNPTNGKITIDHFNANRIEIYNIRGKLMEAITANNRDNSMQLDVSNLPRGMYFIRLISTKSIVQKPFFKQ